MEAVPAKKIYSVMSPSFSLLLISCGNYCSAKSIALFGASFASNCLCITRNLEHSLIHSVFGILWSMWPSGPEWKGGGQSEKSWSEWKKLIRVKKWRYHRHVMFLIICPVAVTTCISRLYLSSFILWWPDDHLMTNQNVRYCARQESQVTADSSPATQKSDWAARLYV